MAKRLYPVAVLISVFTVVLAVTSVPIARSTDSERPKVNREAVLGELAVHVAAPAYADLATRCSRLSEVIAILRERPDEESIRNARERWMDAAASAQRISCFKIGPIADGGYAPSFYFCPIRPASIERVLSAKQPLSEGGVEELGAAAKGICAIEYLLFSPSAEAAARRLAEVDGGKRREYLRLLAAELARKSAQLAKDWNAPLSQSATHFVEGRQGSLNLLVNQLAWSLENLNEKKLRPIVAPDDGEASSGGAPGAGARMLARMQGVQRVFLGGDGTGLDDLLRQVNPSAAQRMDDGLKQALSALAVLDEPLKPGETLADKARVAYEASRAVEVLIKVDVTSALGVTLTFSPIDGD